MIAPVIIVWALSSSQSSRYEVFLTLSSTVLPDCIFHGVQKSFFWKVKSNLLLGSLLGSDGDEKGITNTKAPFEPFVGYVSMQTPASEDARSNCGWFHFGTSTSCRFCWELPTFTVIKNLRWSLILTLFIRFGNDVNNEIQFSNLKQNCHFRVIISDVVYAGQLVLRNWRASPAYQLRPLKALSIVVLKPTSVLIPQSHSSMPRELEIENLTVLGFRLNIDMWHFSL